MIPPPRMFRLLVALMDAPAEVPIRPQTKISVGLCSRTSPQRYSKRHALLDSQSIRALAAETSGRK